MRYFVFIKYFVLLGLLISMSPANSQWLADEQSIMGTLIKVELWHKDTKEGRKYIDLVMTEMHRIDQLMSPHKKDSEVTIINNNAARAPVKVSRELYDLIDRSLQVSRQTEGMFDITFSSVGHLFNYKRELKPSQIEINKALAAVNFRFIKLDKRKQSVRFKREGVRIDLGGIAKGHAVDKSIQLLRDYGIDHAIVSAGGDSRMIGDRRGRPWMVGIRHPRVHSTNVAVLPVQNTAISTSGDYERFFIDNGKRYHHIINPLSGNPASHLQSVTVIGSNATTTDALSTSIFVMGLKKGLGLVESLRDIEAVIIDGNGNLHFSSGLRDISNSAKEANSH